MITFYFRTYIFNKGKVPSMPLLVVDKYKIEYNFDNKKAKIYLHCREGKEVITGKYDNLSAEEALFLADMLRNEKPIFYDTKHQIVQTGSEPPGEGNEN